MKKEVIQPEIPKGIDPELEKFFVETIEELARLRLELVSDISENYMAIDDYVVDPTWIAVTYINSWVDHSANTVSEYYKDVFGFVHLRLGCKSGITDNPFAMPAGYRPGRDIYYPIYSTPSGTTVIPRIRFKTDGTVEMDNYINTFCIHGEIIYRAEN
jgi:hypothetical protein